jgi:hypothetical protein
LQCLNTSMVVKLMFSLGGLPMENWAAFGHFSLGKM